MRSKLTLAACATVAAAALACPAAARAAADRPFELFDALERNTGLKLVGFLQVGVSSNDTSTHDRSGGGHSNLPVAGPNDEGLQLNAIELALSRKMQSNLIPRVTPLPGPVPSQPSWGVFVEALYGRNGLPASIQGLDADWGINRTQAGVIPGHTRQNYFVVPQMYAEFYAPLGLGTTLMLGRFGSGVGREIPPAWRPSPNFFYSKTYAFISQPDQVVGGLLSTNLSRGPAGLLAAELGVVNGRQNWKDNNSNKTVIGALRWRSGDMRTWVNYSFMRGNEQNSLSVIPQMPIARIVSPRGQLRQHHSVSVKFEPTDAIELVGEVLMGKQAGDGKPDTIDLVSGPSYTGGRYSGINGEFRYRLSPVLRAAVRAEMFRDRNATALFPATAASGDFNAVTLGLNYDVTKNVVIHSEIRHDWQSRSAGTKAFGGGTASKQTTVSADVVFYF